MVVPPLPPCWGRDDSRPQPVGLGVLHLGRRRSRLGLGLDRSHGLGVLEGLVGLDLGLGVGGRLRRRLGGGGLTPAGSPPSQTDDDDDGAAEHDQERPVLVLDPVGPADGSSVRRDDGRRPVACHPGPEAEEADERGDGSHHPVEPADELVPEVGDVGLGLGHRSGVGDAELLQLGDVRGVLVQRAVERAEADTHALAEGLLPLLEHRDARPELGDELADLGLEPGQPADEVGRGALLAQLLAQLHELVLEPCNPLVGQGGAPALASELGELVLLVGQLVLGDDQSRRELSDRDASSHGGHSPLV